MRLYMMERFLERLAISKYKDNFIIKGGMLISSFVGVQIRSTMDIDASIKNQNMNKDNVSKIIKEIINIKLDDNAIFKIKNIVDIMDEMEYSGFRITMDGFIDDIIVPFKVDISTGDIITPRPIEHNFVLVLENKSITMWSYNIETIIAEKLQTIIVRDIFNTRMRDFYDIYILTKIYKEKLDYEILKEAYLATSKNRQTIKLVGKEKAIIVRLKNNPSIFDLWEKYRNKYSYVCGISFLEIIKSIESLIEYIDKFSKSSVTAN